MWLCGRDGRLGFVAEVGVWLCGRVGRVSRVAEVHTSISTAIGESSSLHSEHLQVATDHIKDLLELKIGSIHQELQDSEATFSAQLAEQSGVLSDLETQAVHDEATAAVGSIHAELTRLHEKQWQDGCSEGQLQMHARVVGLEARMTAQEQVMEWTSAHAFD